MRRVPFYVAIITCIIGVGLGYSMRPKPTIDSKKQVETDVTTHETTTIIQNKKGTVKTVIVRDIVDKTKIEEHVVFMPKKPVLSVLALAGANPKMGILIPIYGISVSKEVFGPFTVGAFGYTSGMVGLSVGINF